MIPFVLPNMFLIADLANNDEFVKYILPKLKPIFKLQKPIQVLINKYSKKKFKKC